MSQRKHEHPLRTIVLEYDDAKPETDYEKELVKSYIALHDEMFAFQTFKGKLMYEYKLFDDSVEEAAKAFLPIASAIETFLQEITTAKQKEIKRDGLGDFTERMHDFHENNIPAYHADIIDPLAAECTRLETEYETYVEADEHLEESFTTHENETAADLYKNYDNYSLDLVRYDDDIEELREVWSKINLDKERDPVIDHYNELMDNMKESYAKWEEIKLILSTLNDDSGLLDSSLSDSYAAGNTDTKNRPVYMIAPGDKLVEDFRLNYSLLANSDKHTLTVSVPMESVQQGDVLMLQQLVMQLQHFPKMIEKWIFAIDVVFKNHDDIDMTEDDWKGHAVPVKWFNKLNSLACTIFFIQDHDARAYMLMGDLVVDGKLSPAQNGEAVFAEGEALKEIQQRLWNACWVFLVYCHNTGFDPQPYIEALMSDFEAAFTFEEVYKQYEEDTAKGIELKIIPQKGGKPLNPEEED